MKVIVFGAHGKIGQQFVRQAKAHTITAVIRNQAQADQIGSLSEASTKELTLDSASVEDLSSAISGHDAVVFTAGSGGKDLLKVDLDGAVKTFEASVAANVRRFVLISAIHADKREHIDKLPIRNYFIAKHYADRILINEFKESLDFTILKPTALTDEPATGKISLVHDMSEPVGSITREDVARVILQVLPDQKSYGKSYDFKNGDTNVGDNLFV